MPLNPGDVKIIPPLQTTMGNVDGQAIPVFRIFFSVRGQGSYSVLVPQAGFTAERAQAAIEQFASQIVDTLDKFS